MSRTKRSSRRNIRSGNTARSKRAQRSKRQAGPYMRIWQSRGFVLGLMIILVVISLSVVRESIRRVETQREIVKLEEEVEQLAARNSEITDTIALLQTSSHQEKEARVKLGLQKEGEQVIILPGNAPDGEIQFAGEQQNTADGSTGQAPTEKVSNPRKWVNFFRNNYNNS